jgi:hypothetical protein
MQSNWAGRVAQVVECLPSTFEALSLSPSTTNKTKNQTNKKCTIKSVVSPIESCIKTH